MRSRSRYSLPFVAVAVLLTFSGAHSIQRVALGSEGQNEGATETRIVGGFQAALTLARSNYAGTIDTDKVMSSSIEGMLHTLDPHSSYFDRKSWQAFQSEQRSTYSGIGSVIGQHNGKVYISAPFDGTPAYKAGILYGDQIVSIDGESADGWAYQQVSAKLLGTAGTPVSVKVVRP